MRQFEKEDENPSSIIHLGSGLLPERMTKFYDEGLHQDLGKLYLGQQDYMEEVFSKAVKFYNLKDCPDAEKSLVLKDMRRPKILSYLNKIRVLPHDINEISRYFYWSLQFILVGKALMGLLGPRIKMTSYSAGLLPALVLTEMMEIDDFIRLFVRLERYLISVQFVASQWSVCQTLVRSESADFEHIILEEIERQNVSEWVGVKDIFDERSLLIVGAISYLQDFLDSLRSKDPSISCTLISRTSAAHSPLFEYEKVLPILSDFSFMPPKIELMLATGIYVSPGNISQTDIAGLFADALFGKLRTWPSWHEYCGSRSIFVVGGGGDCNRFRHFGTVAPGNINRVDVSRVSGH